MDIVKSGINSIRAKLSEYMLPKGAEFYLANANKKFSDMLPYETTLSDDDGREVFILSDGSLGVMWEMPPVAHELLSEQDLDYRLSQFGKILEKLVSDDITIQFFFQKGSELDFSLPDWNTHVESFAREVINQRIKTLKNCDNQDMKLQKIKINICLRLEAEKNQFDANSSDFDKVISSIVNATRTRIKELEATTQLIEDSFKSRFNQTLQRCRASDLLIYLRKLLHSRESQTDKFFAAKDFDGKNERIADYALNGSMEWKPGSVSVGGDSLEVLSWMTQPQAIYPGIMTQLLQIPGEFNAILNIRPKNYVSDLEKLSEQANGSDPLQKRQKQQIDEVHDRVVGGEKLLHTSFHIIYRNNNAGGVTHNNDLRGKQTAKQISDVIPTFVEEYSCFLAFLSCLPFNYSKKIAPILARERRIPTGDIGYLLPVLGGVKGATRPKQLMQSRLSEATWLNNRQCPTNAHFSVYGESGSGKSFFMANHIVAESAYDPDLITIIIDSITSYEYLVKALGEDIGYQIIKPPKVFPNIFNGELTKERIGIITSTIKVAVALISKVEITAPEESLLADAIVGVYQNNLESATKRYVKPENPNELGDYESARDNVMLPRLTDVINSFPQVAAKKSLSKEIVKSLTEKLLPFYGSGPYSNLFDQVSSRKQEERAAGITLYDLADISDDKNLCTITTLILIAETERIIKHPLNTGRKGILIFEEAQSTLNAKNPILSDYIKSAYARFRKLGWSCGCIANTIDAYADMPGPRSAWNLSATKIILPVSNESERAKLPEIIKNEYHCNLVSSLIKVPGKFSQFLYLSNPIKCTGIYVPSGHDYWLSANESMDTDVIDYVSSLIDGTKSFQAAINILAEFAPMGFRDEVGDLRELYENEKLELKTIANQYNVNETSSNKVKDVRHVR